MAPSSFTDDYYATLGVRQAAGEDEIKLCYKKLARLRHPDKNPNNPKATSEFQLLQAAYSTLIDPILRRAYDSQYASIRSRAQATAHAWNNAQSSPASNPGETPSKTGPSKKPNQQADETQRYKQQIRELEKALQELYTRRANLGSNLFETRRKVNRSQSALSKMQEEEDKDAQEDTVRNSWLGYFLGKQLSPEEAEARNRRATERKTGRIVREAELERYMAMLRQSQAQMDSLDAEIVEVQEKKSRIQIQERAHQEATRLAEEMRRRAQENERVRKEREKVKKEQEERLEKMRENMERYRKETEARLAREEKLRNAEAEKRRAEEKERKAKEAQKNTQDRDLRKRRGRKWQNGKEGYGERKASMRPGQTVDATSCRHKGWWILRPSLDLDDGSWGGDDRRISDQKNIK